MYAFTFLELSPICVLTREEVGIKIYVLPIEIILKRKKKMKKKIIGFLAILCLGFALNGTIEVHTRQEQKIIHDAAKSVEKNAVRNQGGEFQSAPSRILVKYKKQSNSRFQAEVKSSIEAIYGIKVIKYFAFIDVYLYETY